MVACNDIGSDNVFKKIFRDTWESFKSRYPRYNTEYYDEVVKKMLSCGDPKQLGYIEYQCLSCAHGNRVVPMSCKSSFCLRCSKVYVDNWVSHVSNHLHEGVIYRHIVLTVPEDLRRVFYNNAEKVLSRFMQIGPECIDDFFSRTSRSELKGGYIVVFQSNGRNGQYNPHLHIIASSVGMDNQKGEWKHLGYLPYELLHKKWQWYLLEMLRAEVGTEKIEKLIDICYKTYPEGFVANVQKGDVPSRYTSLAQYLAKYLVSPPISLRRIDDYDGKQVKYHYRSHKTGRVERDEVDVYTLIGRMIQHVLCKGFKRIRYYGVQATKTYEKVKEAISEALSKVKGVVNGAVKIIQRKNYRERYQESVGKDPLICPNCGSEMELWKIWNPKYGTIFYELDEMISGKYEKEPEESNKDGGQRRRTVRSTPRAVQVSMFRV